MRPLALPRLVVAQPSDKIMAERYCDYTDSPTSVVSTHSRESSGASDDYSPLTQTFSFHEQHRFSDSSSSLATTPPKGDQSTDSPRASKTALDDLLEVPDEREDDFDFCDISLTRSQCQCASPICMRQCCSASALERPSLDYSLADGFNSDCEAPLRLSKVRRSTGSSPVGTIANRIGNRLPSLSRRLRDKSSPAPTGLQQSVRSAPASRVPSRTSSFRHLSNSFINHMDARDTVMSMTPPGTPIHAAVEKTSMDYTHQMDIPVQRPMAEEPIDRKALASTPLLPTPLVERRGSDHGSIQSPLQSPKIADSPVFSSAISPDSTPIMSTAATPALSTKPSIASFGGLRSSQAFQSDFPRTESMRIEDKWSIILGHANFIVHPAPYIPERYDSTTCKSLVEDWEEARKQFMHQAARTSEHYGPTSQIYKLTEQKWAEVDSLWRKYHETAVERAKKVERVMGEYSHDVSVPKRDYQPLAEPAPLTKLPSLNDLNNTGKFPKLDEASIVPMVQYAQLTTQASKRTAFLKFFKDFRFPGNTLGRTGPGLRR